MTIFDLINEQYSQKQMERKVKLSVLGFSFNQTKTGTYGMVLSEEMGIRRLMVIVGTPEAQSIAFKLQNSAPPRPLTHDLVQSILSEFGIILQEILIYKYVDGVYFSRLRFKQNNEIVEIESRTSDAVAIALRTKSPIYTTEAIMQEQGIVFEDSTSDIEQNEDDSLDLSLDYSLLNEDELKTMLEDAILGEDYELASILRDELDKKKGDNNL